MKEKNKKVRNSEVDYEKECDVSAYTQMIKDH